MELDEEYKSAFPKSIQVLRYSIQTKLETVQEQELNVSELERIYRSIDEHGEITVDEAHSKKGTITLELRAWVDDLDTHAVQELFKWGATASWHHAKEKYKLVHEFSFEASRLEP